MTDEAVKPTRKVTRNEYGTPIRDAAGNPIPTPVQRREEEIRDKRIAQEQADIRDGFNSQPVAGHEEWGGRGGFER